VNLAPEIIPGLLLLAAAPAVFWSAGAPLASRLGLPHPGERVAAALLAGLAIVLALTSWLNLAIPLAGPALLVLLLPTALFLARRKWRAPGAEDLRATLFTPRGALVAAAAALFLALLLLPLLARSGVIYYDGTANHDGFFWVTGAEYLRQHTYLDPVRVDPLHPYLNGVRALTGWTPGFGRMGCEGLVALGAALTGQWPVQVYLCVSAALYGVWLAAVYLMIRRFVAERLSAAALAALAFLQPVFAFYHHNANLPNLLGMLCGAGACLAVAHGAQAAAIQRRWPRGPALWAALSGHGVLVSYPELAPFVALPAALLWLRAGWQSPARDQRRALLAFGTAASLGTVFLNPVTTLRAASGFATAFLAARQDATWANIFANVPAAGWLPAWLTLSPKSGTELGMVGGFAATAGLAAAIAVVFRFARDPRGLALTLAGAAVLASYTALTGFHYGWQKTLQFSGVFAATILPAGIVAVAGPGRRRWLSSVLAAGVAALCLYASAIVTLETWKWSGRKKLERDWLPLLEVRLPGDTRVEPSTFPQPFFHGMWSTYFLRHTPLVFPTAAGDNVGYLLNTTATVATRRAPVEAWFVGRAWAERRGVPVPALREGQGFALLPVRPPLE